MTASKLDPDLLRACAAYLAYSDVYVFAYGDSEYDMLRPFARSVVAQRGWRGTEHTPPDADCDRMTRRHLDAMFGYVAGPLNNPREPGMQKLRRVALAILAAPPRVLAWWCERLAAMESRS